MSRKLDADGNFLPFPGITVVSSAVESDCNAAVFLDIYKALQANPRIVENFALLPPESYHMTAVDLCTRAETPGNWLDFVNEKQPFFHSIHRVLHERNITPVVTPHGASIGGALFLMLQVGPRHHKAIRDTARGFDVLHKVPRFHITFGYQTKAIDGELHTELLFELQLIFNAAFAKHHISSFTLAPVKLCYFHDMTKFIPWDATKNPFEVI